MESRQEVTVELIDFYLDQRKNEDFQILITKLKHKLRPRTRFCLNSFDVCCQIDFYSFGKPKNIQICFEYKVILINAKDKILVFDLDTRTFVRSIHFKSHVIWFSLCGFELYTCSLHQVSKYNLKLLFDSVDDNHSTALIWSHSKKFHHVWGINVFEDTVFVCDYFDVLSAFDSRTGMKVSINVPDLEYLDNIEFSSEGEMFVCKRYFIEKLERNSEGCWKSVKKIGPQIEGLGNNLSRPYSMFFEKSSQLLFVSDADRMMFVFDRDLNLVHFVLNYEWDSNCGVFISEQTQELFLCDSRRKRVLIYK